MSINLSFWYLSLFSLISVIVSEFCVQKCGHDSWQFGTLSRSSWASVVQETTYSSLLMWSYGCGTVGQPRKLVLASIPHTYVNASISLTYVNIEKCWFFLEMEIIFALSFSEQMRRQVYMDQRGQAKGKLTRKLLAESSSHILEKIKTWLAVGARGACKPISLSYWVSLLSINLKISCGSNVMFWFLIN